MGNPHSDDCRCGQLGDSAAQHVGRSQKMNIPVYALVGGCYFGSVEETGTTNSLLINPVLPSDGTLILNQSLWRAMPLIKVPCLIVAPPGEPKRGSWRS